MLKFLKWYLESVQGVQEVLFRQSEPNKLTFIGESQGTSFIPKMDHLVCFYAGVLALGSEHVQQPSHMKIGKQLMYTCWQMYERMPTGLSPEIVYFNIDPNSKKDDIIVKVCAHCTCIYTSYTHYVMSIKFLQIGYLICDFTVLHFSSLFS